jgi:fatty acid desaturase
MKLKNLLLAFPLQFPLLFALVFGVHSLTGLSDWWCFPIAFVLDMMYYFGENIRRGE